MLGVSDNRGLADEEVTFIVPEDSDGTVTIQISSFDGAYSNQPWMLRVEESPPIELPPAARRRSPLRRRHDEGAAGVRRRQARSTSSTRSATATSTGNANETAVWNKLQTLAARTDAAGGTVIPVDAIPADGATLGAWAGRPLLARAATTTSSGRSARTSTGSRRPTSTSCSSATGPCCPPASCSTTRSSPTSASYASTFYGDREHAVPELLRARLPADRRSLRRHELLRPRSVHPRSRGRPPRRELTPRSWASSTST